MSWSPCPDPELGDRATAEALRHLADGWEPSPESGS